MLRAPPERCSSAAPVAKLAFFVLFRRLRGLVVKAPALRAEGRGFNSRPAFRAAFLARAKRTAAHPFQNKNCKTATFAKQCAKYCLHIKRLRQLVKAIRWQNVAEAHV